MKATTKGTGSSAYLVAMFRGFAVAVLAGALFAGPVAAENRESQPEKQFSTYLARAIQFWSHEQHSEAVVSPANAMQQRGQFFDRSKAATKLSKKHRGDDGSSDDGSKDDDSSDDKSADDGSSDDKSEDKKLSCLPNLEVEFLPDLLRVSIVSDKKIKSITLLFDDGSTQAAPKPKGKQGIYAGQGDKAGMTLTGVWVRSGCNDKIMDQAIPCPVAGSDDGSSDDDSSSDESGKLRKRYKHALASGDCEAGDESCLSNWLGDHDSSSDDKSDDGSSDDSSDDGSSDDRSDDNKMKKCGQFFENEMAQVTVPVVSIADASAWEGSNDGNTLEFVVTLSEPVPAGQTVEVAFMTVDGTAMAGSAQPDYLAKDGVLLFAAGELTQLIEVDTVGDDFMEEDESFEVLLLGTSDNARLGRDRATGIVLNDDDEDE